MSSLIKAIKLTRGYATTASKKVPLTLHGIEGRYATALYTASVKNNTLDAVEADLKKFKAIIEKSANLKTLLGDPTLNRVQKSKGIEAVLSSIKSSETTKNFFSLLIENSRLYETSKILNSFASLTSAHRGEIQITVASAQPLEAETLKQLKDTLSKSSLTTGSKTVSISNQVKPAIMGGLIIEVGDKTIDLSVSSKISKLSKALNDTI